MLCRLFLRTFVTPSNLKIGLKVPKASGKLEKSFEGPVVKVNYIFDLFCRY